MTQATSVNPVESDTRAREERTDRQVDVKELEDLREENRALLRQLSDNFEELTLLFNIIQVLQVSERAPDLGSLAARILPVLRPQLQAQAVLMLEVRAPAADGSLSESPLVVSCREGGGEVDTDTCVRLVRQYEGEWQGHPVVRNHLAWESSGAGGARIDNLMLAPIATRGKTVGWLLAINRQQDGDVSPDAWELDGCEFGTHEASLLQCAAMVLAKHASDLQMLQEREAMHVSVVRALVSAVEAKDEYTRGHSERVALYARRLAEALGLSEHHCEQVYLSGLLHDIGKIGVQDAVLRKPGRLSDEEYAQIREHPDKGWAILGDLESLAGVLPGMLHHHERYDGSGYPDRLAGEAIPIDGRILAVADAYDAMTSDRPYRAGMPQEQAVALLRSGVGAQWDPQVVSAFLGVMEDIMRIRDSYHRPGLARRRKRSADRGARC